MIYLQGSVADLQNFQTRRQKKRETTKRETFLEHLLQLLPYRYSSIRLNVSNPFLRLMTNTQLGTSTKCTDHTGCDGVR